MTKVTLTDLVNLQNETTAVNALKNNNAVLTTAIENTLSRDGTSPNTMSASLDMNSNQIINLPNPATANSPVRLQDLSTVTGGGTVSSLPVGGTTGQVLAKTSNTNYAVAWTSESAELNAGNNIVLTGTTPTTIATSLTPAFTNVNKVVLTTPATGSTLTILDGKTLTANNSLTLSGTDGKALAVNNNLTLNGTDGTTLTFQGTDTYVGRTTTDTLTNKTLTTPVISSIVNTGTLTLPTSTDTLIGRATTDTLTNKTLTSPTINTPTVSSGSFSSPSIITPVITTSLAFTPTTGGIIGTTTNDSTTTGNVGEHISATLAAGSAISLSTNVAANVTSISLTAGDWDISGTVYFTSAATTNLVFTAAGSSATSATFDGTIGKYCQSLWGYVPGSGVACEHVPLFRTSLSTTTTIFIVVLCQFTVSTLTAHGYLRARRIR